MPVSLEKISEVIARRKKRDYVLVCLDDRLENLDLDSLSTYMVMLELSQIYGFEDEIERLMDQDGNAIERAKKLATVKDLVEYVGYCSGK